MDLKRTWAIFRKEIIHVRRDPISLLEVILLPVILMLLYGYALTFDVKNVTVAVYDQEQSQLSQDFINRFRGTDYFRLTRFVQSYQELADLITDRKVQVGLMIPYDFSRSSTANHVVRLVDGTDSNTANIVLASMPPSLITWSF
jgi:ABC-2 type transport system permease protein